jgi:hypothetical protein
MNYFGYLFLIGTQGATQNKIKQTLNSTKIPKEELYNIIRFFSINTRLYGRMYSLMSKLEKYSTDVDLYRGQIFKEIGLPHGMLFFKLGWHTPTNFEEIKENFSEYIYRKCFEIFIFRYKNCKKSIKHKINDIDYLHHVGLALNRKKKKIFKQNKLINYKICKEDVQLLGFYNKIQQIIFNYTKKVVQIHENLQNFYYHIHLIYYLNNCSEYMKRLILIDAIVGFQESINRFYDFFATIYLLKNENRLQNILLNINNMIQYAINEGVKYLKIEKGKYLKGRYDKINKEGFVLVYSSCDSFNFLAEDYQYHNKRVTSRFQQTTELHQMYKEFNTELGLFDSSE